MPCDPKTQESDDIGDEDFVEERMTDERITRLALWLYLGLFVPGFFWLYAWLYAKLIPQFSLPNTVFVVWFVVYLIALIAAVARLTGAAIRAWWWRRRDSQTRRTWQGRTAECLIMGALLRNGPFFSEKEWREYYAHKFHMSDGAPTGSP